MCYKNIYIYHRILISPMKRLNAYWLVCSLPAPSCHLQPALPWSDTNDLQMGIRPASQDNSPEQNGGYSIYIVTYT